MFFYAFPRAYAGPVFVCFVFPPPGSHWRVASFVCPFFYVRFYDKRWGSPFVGNLGLVFFFFLGAWITLHGSADSSEKCTGTKSIGRREDGARDTILKKLGGERFILVGQGRTSGT